MRAVGVNYAFSLCALRCNRCAKPLCLMSIKGESSYISTKESPRINLSQRATQLIGYALSALDKTYRMCYDIQYYVQTIGNLQKGRDI